MENYQEEVNPMAANQKNSSSNEKYTEDNYLENDIIDEIHQIHDVPEDNNDQQCFDSVIQDLVIDYQNEQNDKFQYTPMQTMQENHNYFMSNLLDFEDISMRYSNSANNENFCNTSNSNVDNNYIMNVEGRQSSAASAITFENITDSTTSSLDEKTKKTDNYSSRQDTLCVTPKSDTFYSFSSTVDGGGNHEQQQMQLQSTQQQSSLNEYDRAFNEDILFVCAEEIINSTTNFNDSNLPHEIVEHLDDDDDDNDVVDSSVTVGAATKAEQPIELCNKHENNDIKIGDGLQPQPTKGRIYVIGNLMKDSAVEESTSLDETDAQNDAAVSVTSVASSPAPVMVEESNDEEAFQRAGTKVSVAAAAAKDKQQKKKQKIGRPKGRRNTGTTSL